MLVTTAVFGCTSHFCWGNDPDEKPAVIAPHNVLNFVIDFCHDKDIVHAPRWVWWMLFARASSRNKFLKNHREAYLEMHNRIFNHRKDNIDYYNMFDWVAGLSLPDEFLDAALGVPSFGDSGVKEMGWDRFGKRKYDLPDSPCLVVPLTDFLRENFLVLIQAKADDSFIKDTGFQVSLLCNMIRQQIENMQSKEEKHRNEELVEQLKPFLQQADKIMIKATTLIKRVDRKEVVTDSEKKKAALKV
ncbi:hypothetical protein BT96DRAFT_492559 [Gymnopus androsaceus JB14]|uniref:DUF6987 domain-containing protein n=1 Tax=Gymnopus androsaceus JB14 TaxID=1447944 RepID=A0A6A4GPK5_9AGAR|nr:hypothetical protein BT96DRAFT_492559 [Gymnopus androsaceus JB14]